MPFVLLFGYLTSHLGRQLERFACAIEWEMAESTFLVSCTTSIIVLFTSILGRGLLKGQGSYGMMWIAGRVIWDFLGPRALVLQICWDLIVRACLEYDGLYLYYDGIPGQMPETRIYDMFDQAICQP